MNFSLSRFTEFICELQSQKTFGYQSLFKLLEKYYGVEDSPGQWLGRGK